MKWIFVDGRARKRIDSSRQLVGKTTDKPEPVLAVEDGNAREKLIEETMSLYREKRAEYEKLDSDLRDKIDKVVREAFGDKKE